MTWVEGGEIQVSAEYFTCFETGSQTSLQFAMQLTLVFLTSAPLCWNYQCLLPCLVDAVLEIWPRVSCMLSKHSITKLDPTLLSPINIFTVDVATSLAIKIPCLQNCFYQTLDWFYWKYGLSQTLYWNNVFFIFAGVCGDNEQ